MMALKENFFLVLVALIFLLGISAPLVRSSFEPDLKISKSEKRSLAQLPQWHEAESLKDYFNSMNAYATDQFGFREFLIGVNTRLRWILGYSPSPKVIRGRDDWLFLKTIDPLLSQHKYGLAAAENGLKERANYIRTMQTNLGNKGIAYQLVVAANKMNVYEEYLPTKFGLTNIRASYEQYKSHFSKHELQQQIFSEEVLLSKKPDFEESFYFKNDTHWNQLGAYLVFRASLEKLNERFPQIKFDAPKKEFEFRMKQAGDLANYISLGNQIEHLEPSTKFRKCARRKFITAYRSGVNQSSCERNQTIVLFIGDSFMPYIVPYYSESVGKVYMVSQTIRRRELAKLIEELEPTVVIEQIVERSLPGTVP